jgi:hypothetical protein
MKERKMKIQLFLTLVILIILPGIAGAEDFLTVSVTPDGTTINKTDRVMEFSTGLSHDAAVSYYKEYLNNTKDKNTDIKIRDWKAVTYIEDDGRRQWHSISISKEPKENRTTIVITKDSWGWIASTLLLRFIGVFIVLMILYFGLQISGFFISRGVAKATTK